ncbi:MAG TPA: hypothetical protein VGJ21_04025 [Terracidiphilus sp.]|jgi:hypothetical protein
MKHLRKGVDLWPLIANPSASVQQRINQTLAKLNLKLADSLKQCDADYREWSKQSGDNATKDSSGDWERKIRVTMIGPRLLSMVAADSQFCGGAYPNAETFAMVFDLNTGKPLNWMAIIAPSSQAKPYSDTIYDGTTVGALIVPALLEMSRAKADAECKDALEDGLSYQLWPDAKTGTLVAEPFDLPHVVAACAEDLSLTPAQARKLGFDESILTAIEQAHHK